MFKFSYLWVVLCLISLQLSAQSIDENLARKVATNFLSKQNKNDLKDLNTLPLNLIERGESNLEGRIPFYKFQWNDQVIVVSADRNFPPILSWGDAQNLIVDPSNIKLVKGLLKPRM